MMHSVPRTFSPSSLRMTRSTPCVEGCWGPILSTNSVESKNVESGIQTSLAAFDTHILLHPALVLLQDPVVLAQRIALPFLGQQDTTHVRMPGKLDAEHVEHFALQPVRRQVYTNGGLGFVAIGDVGLDPHPFVAGKTIENVDHVEPLGALEPVDCGDIDQVVE